MVVERTAVATFPLKDLPLILKGAFHAYNIHYTQKGARTFIHF